MGVGLPEGGEATETVLSEADLTEPPLLLEGDDLLGLLATGGIDVRVAMPDGDETGKI